MALNPDAAPFVPAASRAGSAFRRARELARERSIAEQRRRLQEAEGFAQRVAAANARGGVQLTLLPNPRAAAHRRRTLTDPAGPAPPAPEGGAAPPPPAAPSADAPSADAPSAGGAPAAPAPRHGVLFKTIGSDNRERLSNRWWKIWQARQMEQRRQRRELALMRREDRLFLSRAAAKGGRAARARPRAPATATETSSSSSSDGPSSSSSSSSSDGESSGEEPAAPALPPRPSPSLSSVGASEAAAAMAAAAADDVGAVEAFCASYGSAWDLREPTERKSIVHVAALHGAERCLSALLRGGCSTAVLDRRRRTPLHLSALGGRAACAELLLAHGFAPDARDKRGNAPLHCACANGHFTLAIALLRAGADASASNRRLESPLLLALQAFFAPAPENPQPHPPPRPLAPPPPPPPPLRAPLLDLCAALVHAGAQPGQRDADGLTPAAAAAAHGDTELLAILLTARPPAAPVAPPPERWAAEGRARARRRAAARRARPRSTMVLHAAARNGHADCMRLLLGAAAEEGAAAEGPRRRLPVEGLGLDLGVDPLNCREGVGQGDTPLTAAARSGSIDCAEALLRCGAGVHRMNRAGETPLLVAVAAATGAEPCGPSDPRMRMVRLLLRHGAARRADAPGRGPAGRGPGGRGPAAAGPRAGGTEGILDIYKRGRKGAASASRARGSRVRGRRRSSGTACRCCSRGTAGASTWRPCCSPRASPRAASSAARRRSAASRRGSATTPAPPRRARRSAPRSAGARRARARRRAPTRRSWRRTMARRRASTWTPSSPPAARFGTRRSPPSAPPAPAPRTRSACASRRLVPDGGVLRVLRDFCAGGLGAAAPDAPPPRAALRGALAAAAALRLPRLGAQARASPRRAAPAAAADGLCGALEAAAFGGAGARARAAADELQRLCGGRDDGVAVPRDVSLWRARCRLCPVAPAAALGGFAVAFERPSGGARAGAAGGAAVRRPEGATVRLAAVGGGGEELEALWCHAGPLASSGKLAALLEIDGLRGRGAARARSLSVSGVSAGVLRVLVAFLYTGLLLPELGDEAVRWCSGGAEPRASREARAALLLEAMVAADEYIVPGLVAAAARQLAAAAAESVAVALPALQLGELFRQPGLVLAAAAAALGRIEEAAGMAADGVDAGALADMLYHTLRAARDEGPAPALAAAGGAAVRGG